MTPDEFISHWSPGGGGYGMSERAGAQPHFIGLCALLGVDAPNDAANYTFEFGTRKIDQKRGFADVFKRGCFGWEYKAPGGDLTAALRQLKDYANALDNPPLLIVSDRLAFEIHTQFTGRPTETYRISLKHLGDPAQRDILRRAFVDPASFQPKRTNRDITEEAAKAFADVAERMRHERREPPERVAHFLTQCLFCFFAEDVGLLPERLFEKLVAKQITPEKLRGALIELFEKMQRGGLFGMEDIPWFNGGLFQKIDVPMITPMDVAALKTASQLNWSAIDVAIFGTLFERGLDPKKRSQLGAHYTDPATIMRIVTPVVERPLRAEWALVRDDIAKLTSKSKKHGDAAATKAKAALIKFLDRLAGYRVLDPACGSGNFLYLALKTLKDIEHSVHVEAEALGVERPLDLVTSPANVLGIELNEYAAELARVTVWIGELQWRLQHGYPFKQNPVLEPLDHIECRDALLTTQPVNSKPVRPERSEGSDTVTLEPSNPSLRSGRTEIVEALWPRADAVIGNPPFVGGSKKRRELGDETFEALAKIYEGRVPAGADLVCYWFDKALQQMKLSELLRGGFVATQSVRAGSNRAVIDSICDHTQIFDAWSDEPWINDGAAVRVSLICYGESDSAQLDGASVPRITADLGVGGDNDVSNVARLSANAGTTFEGTKKYGDFDVSGDIARRWLLKPNVDGRSNGDVVKPWRNGNDLARRPSDTWIIDFGTAMLEHVAALYEAPFQHVLLQVKPERMKVRRERTARLWWLHEEARVSMRTALKNLPRFIATPRVAKHRFFVFLHSSVLPDTRLNVIARMDDSTFGVLCSRIHEVWSLANASMHGVGNDPTYNAKSCFETFPFPAGLTPLD
ncbi:MAG: class I SAM-dependent DNA methyltransferase, partial [Burkholderiales bacterium]|nr:class I SAM-dependent DNA methyltransferase [Burkholderiales bacterium]